MTKTEYWRQCELADHTNLMYEAAVDAYHRHAIGWYEYEYARSAKDNAESKRISMWLELCKQKESTDGTTR